MQDQPGSFELSPRQALGAVRRLAEAPCIETVWHLAVQALGAFGFVRVNYGYTRYKVGLSIGDPQDALFLSTHALDRVRHFHESGLYLRSPEYHWVINNVGACSWGWVAQQRAAGLLTEEECAAMDENGAQRQRAGYSVSFAEGAPRSKGAMGLAAAQGVSQADVDALWQAEGDAIMAICAMAHYKLSQMPLPVPRATLTDRQREILDWIADGKTLQDVCVLTGLSLSAVEKHLRRARDVLAVETTAQAIAKASFLNQMFTMGGYGH